MITLALIGYVRLRDLLTREKGQDLVEYALVVALIAFGAIAGNEVPVHQYQQRLWNLNNADFQRLVRC